MSTILDALKKSEQERKRKNVPRLSDMPVPQERSRWPWVLLGVALIGFSVLLAVLLLGGQRDRIAIPPDVGSSIREEADKRQADQQDPLAVVLNVLSYSEDVEKRFVIIDGKMYREKEFIRAGLLVEQINSSSVVLNLRGKLITKTP